MGEITDRVSELEARQEKLELDLIEARMILRDQVGTAFETLPDCAREAARLLANLRDGVDLDQVYERTLKSIDKMLTDAFPGDIATIEGRVAAACTNTRILRVTQARIERIEQDNKALGAELDRERRAHAEVNRKHLATQKDVDHYRDLMIAQRARADAAESEVEKLRKQRPEGVTTERFVEVEKVKNYWKTMAEIHKADLDTTKRKLAQAEADRDTWQNMATDNGRALAEAASHDVQDAAARMRQIRKIADDRGSFWVQGVHYAPSVKPGACEVKLAEAQRKLDQIQEALEQ